MQSKSRVLIEKFQFSVPEKTTKASKQVTQSFRVYLQQQCVHPPKLRGKYNYENVILILILCYDCIAYLI